MLKIGYLVNGRALNIFARCNLGDQVMLNRFSRIIPELHTTILPDTRRVSSFAGRFYGEGARSTFL